MPQSGRRFMSFVLRPRGTSKSVAEDRISAVPRFRRTRRSTTPAKLCHILLMADRWVVAYDVDTDAAKSAEVTVQTVYNRIRARVRDYGFTEFAQLSVYAMEETDGTLVKLFQALQALSSLEERKYIKRLHVFKIDGSLNDALPIVDNRDSAAADE